MPISTKPYKSRSRFVQVDEHFGIYHTPGVPIPPSGIGNHVATATLAYASGAGAPEDNERRILADGDVVISRGHECKRIFHINMVPPPPSINMLLPFIVAGSSNKCVFAVGSVIGTHEPIAVSLWRGFGFNLSCQENGPALEALVFNLTGSVYLGFTVGDFLTACLHIRLAKLTSVVASRAAGWLVGRLPKGLLKSSVLPLLGKLDLPKVYRGDLGRFASVSEKVVNDAFTAIAENLLGNLIESSSPHNRMQSAADSIGRWIDGRSEPFTSPR